MLLFLSIWDPNRSIPPATSAAMEAGCTLPEPAPCVFSVIPPATSTTTADATHVIPWHSGDLHESIEGLDASDQHVSLIGRGRSAVVWRIGREDEQAIARKVFQGDPLANALHWIASGASNPYGWNTDAVDAAVCRRRILGRLVKVWLGDRVRLPALLGSGQETETGRCWIDMELIRGRGPQLRHADQEDQGAESLELWNDIMKPLQRHLASSGFDGLPWQAGLGQPVAMSNFLREDNSGGSGASWVWVDLESGIPAILPMNPWRLLTYYLPRSFRHGHLLFDDVDVDRLESYLRDEASRLEAALGRSSYQQLLDDTRQLRAAQDRWHRAGRLERGIACWVARGRITDEEACWYLERPVHWMGRMVREVFHRGVKCIPRLARWTWSWIRPRRLFHAAVTCSRFVSSQQWRARFARSIIRRRIRAWKHRRQLSPEQAMHLSTHARSDEAADYLTDFGMHVAIKIPVKITEWVIFPALFAAGMIGELTLVLGIALGGMIARSLYTLWRMGQAFMRRRELPWVALGVGALPIVGNAAYPAQVLWTSGRRDHDVARFILVDIITSLGRRMPVWGGPDTMTEHWFNRCSALPLRWLSRRGSAG